MQSPRDAKAIIGVMKKRGDFNTDAELADFLGVSKVTIASWRKRNSVPVEKCILFSQKKMISLDSMIFEGSGDIIINVSHDNVWAVGVSIHFYQAASGSFLYGDKWRTSLWWGKTFPMLVKYYEAEVFSLSSKNGISLEDAAIQIMKVVDGLEPGDMIALLEDRMQHG